MNLWWNNNQMANFFFFKEKDLSLNEVKKLNSWYYKAILEWEET